MGALSPTEAFLLVAGALAVLSVIVTLARRLGAGRTLSFPRRPDNRGAIAEHQEHYWS